MTHLLTLEGITARVVAQGGDQTSTETPSDAPWLTFSEIRVEPGICGTQVTTCKSQLFTPPTLMVVATWQVRLAGLVSKMSTKLQSTDSESKRISIRRSGKCRSATNHNRIVSPKASSGWLLGGCAYRSWKSRLVGRTPFTMTLSSSSVNHPSGRRGSLCCVGDGTMA